MMLRYVGDGTQVPGVPPRDLSDEEAARWGAVIGEVDGARVAAGLRPLYEVSADHRPLIAEGVGERESGGLPLSEEALTDEPALTPPTPSPNLGEGGRRRKGRRSFDSAGQTAASSAQDDSAGEGDHEGSPLQDEEGE